MDQTLLVLEIMIELAFAGAGCLDDFIGAGEVDSLLVKQVRRGGNYLAFRFDAGAVMFFHDCFTSVLLGTDTGPEPTNNQSTTDGPFCTRFPQRFFL